MKNTLLMLLLLAGFLVSPTVEPTQAQVPLPLTTCIAWNEAGVQITVPCPVTGSCILYEPYEGHLIFNDRLRALGCAVPIYNIPVTPAPAQRVMMLVDLRVRETCSYSSPARYVAAFGSELLLVNLVDDGGEWLPPELVNPLNEWAVVIDKDGVQGCVLTKYRRLNEAFDRNLVAFVTR